MSNDLKVQYEAIESLRAHQRNARTHSKKQLRQIVQSIRKFGFTNPVLTTRDGQILAGHGRVEAAKLIGMDQVPTIAIDHLSEAEQRAYILADNKIALNAGWDLGLLAAELSCLTDLGLQDVTGFTTTEIDLVLDGARNASADRSEPSAEDEIGSLPDRPTSRAGDLWQLGRHVLLCGDARNLADHQAVTFGEPVDLVFTDPPYNCRISGHVSGLGKTKHREFVMASGEMSPEQFRAFLLATLGNAAACCKDGAIAYVCIDWRGLATLLAVGEEVFTEQKQLCVWNKTNGGMGAFYRSKHELVLVYKIGSATHTNNFGLGDGGRYRTNVWDYPGVSGFSASKPEESSRHPTPKPVALVADALRDCTNRGEVVLDPFGGSGSTLIAAEITGRCARVIEYDPAYCDLIIDRFQQFTGTNAILMTSGRTFEELAEERPQQQTGSAA